MKVAVGLLLVATLAYAEEMTVQSHKGAVKGVRVDHDFGQYYYAFRGIRYAKAPVGKLRFKAPVEVEPYEEEFDATDDGNVCPQYDIGSGGPAGDEDCLNLNVYTPKIDGKKRAVMVYIHGGAFIMGGGASYFFGPNYLLENDVVLVTFNYRLGALGFLATDDKAAAGNYGIQDQIMVLKWVQKNIEKFGGDANKVTIMGEDAGAASVTILAMSPLANDLFHGAITLSGNALCDQYMQKDPNEAAVELANRLECSSEKGEDIVNCLSRQTQQDIIKAANSMAMFFSFPRWFVPNVDGTVLPDTPENLLIEGKFTKVPFIVGQTKDEGAFFYRLTLNSFNNGQYDDNFIDHKLPRILPVMSNYNTKLYPITRQVRKRYFVNVDLENEDEFRPKYVDFLTDLMYTRCTDRFAKILANHSVPTYQYLFDYRGQYSIVNLQGEQVDMGVAHGDDLQYIFSDIWGDDLSMSPTDTKFSRNIFAPLLTNFAKTSVPTPTITDAINVAWTPLAPNKNRVFRIGDKLAVDEDYKQDILKFWHEDIPKLFKKKASTKKGKDEL
jgi:carboxylesterase 2